MQKYKEKNMEILIKQIGETTDNGVKTVGYILQEMCRISSVAKALILQDLEHQDMSIEKCYKSIYEYAKKHKNSNCFSSAVFGIDTENEIIKIIIDFYKIPEEWFSKVTPSIASAPKQSSKKNLLDFL